MRLFNYAPRLRRVLDDDFWDYLPFGPVVSLVVVLLAAALAVYVAVVRSRTTRTTAIAMLIVSILVVLMYTGRGSLANANGAFSWRIGHSIRGEFTNINRSVGVANLLGNVALFVPIGWLTAVLSGRRRLLIGTLAGLLLSTAVEVWQMASGSFGDIDDIVLNTLGALLGAGTATLLASRDTTSNHI